MTVPSGCRCVTSDGPCDAVVGIGPDGLCAYCREMHPTTSAPPETPVANTRQGQL